MAPVISIVFDQATGVFFPGQTITGRVHVNNDKERKCEGISLKFHGIAHVQFSESVSTGAGKDRKTERRTYNATEEYYKSKYFVWTDPNQVLPPGRMEFPMNFIIPPNSPASFLSAYGTVLHYCEARIKVPGLSKDAYCKRPYSVNSLLDLNLDPGNRASQLRQGVKTLCCLCCRSGPITAAVRLDRTGYVPGEAIIVSGEINNSSSRKVTSTKAELYMSVQVLAVGRNKLEYYRLMQLSQPEIPKGGDCVWDGHHMIIPPVAASGLLGCNIINVSYVLKFTVQPQLPATPMVLDFPITIGSIPLLETFQQFTSGPQMAPQPPLGFMDQPSTSAGTKGDGSYPPDDPPAYSPPAFPGMEQYPDMPPPSYCQAVSPDMAQGSKFAPSAPAADGPQEPSAPEFNFTPTYVSYTLSGVRGQQQMTTQVEH